ncbi:DUF1868 domain-containing protein [Kaistia adipata]|uniref:DUF1868 domain-containing protein n=1 Tax=Kaistia adipata TaxID=166954 RepID=UPI00040181E9|nr:DUF1868 domain-containing protein [Kaistia adipata]
MTTTRPAASLGRFSASANAAPPRHLGRRYDRDGTFLNEPGNTIVCHLVEGSASQAAIVEVRRRMLAMPDAGRLAFTPVSSLHMTLFQGILEDRRDPPFWPTDMPRDASIDAMTTHYLDRLAGFAAREPFAVEIVDVVPTGLTVAGATAADRRAMKAWRDALAETFGYRHPDHDDYVFHVTLAYVIEWLPEERLEAWQDLFDECLALLRRAPRLELRPPAFCSFEDMKHFEILREFPQ